WPPAVAPVIPEDTSKSASPGFMPSAWGMSFGKFLASEALSANFAAIHGLAGGSRPPDEGGRMYTAVGLKTTDSRPLHPAGASDSVPRRAGKSNAPAASTSVAPPKAVAPVRAMRSSAVPDEAAATAARTAARPS